MYKSIAQNKLDTPANQAALAYLEMRKHRPGMTHPDIAERLQALGQQLPQGRVYLYGPSTILVAGKTKLIVGIGIGTAHALKTGSSFQNAIDVGAKTIQIWSDKTSLNITEAIAPDWIFGGWKDEEANWLKANF